MNLILIRFPLIEISHNFTANILSVSVVISFVIYHNFDAHFKAEKNHVGSVFDTLLAINYLKKY